MIIYSDSFLLSTTGAAADLKYPRIGYQTFTFGLAPANVTVSTEAVGFPKDAPLRPDTGEAWLPTALPATWKVDLGATQSIDYVGIAGHSVGSSGASAKAETSMDGASWSAMATEIAPSDDAPLLFLDTVRNARYVRVTLAGAGTIPSMAVVYAGVALVMEREVTGSGFKPITLSRQTMLQASMSRGGHFLGQGFRRNGVAASAPFTNLDPDWYRASFDPFVKHARRYPYFFAWWPAEYPTEIGYVWSEKDIVPSYSGVIDKMSVAWDMVGIGNP